MIGPKNRKLELQSKKNKMSVNKNKRFLNLIISYQRKQSCIDMCTHFISLTQAERYSKHQKNNNPYLKTVSSTTRSLTVYCAVCVPVIIIPRAAAAFSHYELNIHAHLDQTFSPLYQPDEQSATLTKIKPCYNAVQNTS